MERFNALGRGAQIMLVAGVLLLIDTFLPWQDLAAQFGGFDTADFEEQLGVSVQTTASAWNGLFGVLLGLLVLVLVAWGVVRLAAVNIPLPVSSAMTAALLGTLIPLLAVTKAIFQEGSTVWSYIGAVLAVVIGVGAWRTVQEAGGINTLSSEIPSMPKAPQTDDAPRATPPPPPTAPGPEPVAATAVGPSLEAAPATASTSASEPASVPPPPGRFCQNCGAERAPGARFCTSCGHA
jgi:hypothetical protein